MRIFLYNNINSARNLGCIFEERRAFSHQILSRQILLLSYSSTSVYPVPT